ncbi:ribosome-associated GTPase EngA [Actinobacteria bacterium IMCC26207]|jgi:GTP-binding protein|nr:ribosome-associated GTPase EngA [Actinobacteria bacterium IMCC26207]
MTSTDRLPLVAIVGRPNVGKSTLMNRILGRRIAIVEEKSGVTRDRKEVQAEWLGYEFRLVDTGGWMVGGNSLDKKVSRQSEQAIKEADVILFVVDAAIGVTDEDASVGELLRQATAPVLLIANKVDDQRHEAGVWELLSLGLGDPIGISALHGRGTGDMLDQIIAFLPEPEPTEEEIAAENDDGITSIALVGRPNVGKSTLFNRLIGEDRAVVHDMPGTTRDSVDTVVETEVGPLRFIDTAGMRRKSRIDDGTEYFSMVRALKSVDKANVALLVIDATEGITHQDQRLAERVDGAGCPIIVVLNKWELLDEAARQDVLYQMGQKMHFLGDAAVLRVSALNGRGVHRLLPALGEAISQYETRIPTRKVNDLIRRAQQAQPAPHGGRILYATQGATDPPTFTLFTNKIVPASYLRYIERQIRDEFHLPATPIKLRVRRRGD